MSDNPIRDTLDLLRKEGWQKGTYGNQHHGPNCIVGAHMRVVLDIVPGVTLIGDVITDLFPGRRRIGEAIVPEFNDHPDTTFPDVEQVLARAAVKWDKHI